MIKEVDKLKEIIRLDSELNKVQDLDILLERILLEARRVTNAEAGSIYVRRGDKLAIKYSQNEVLQKALPAGQKLIYSIFSIPINKKTISGYVAATSEFVNIPDVYGLAASAPYSFNPKFDKISGYKTQSVLAFPLQTNTGDMLGVIQIINGRDRKGKVIPFNRNCELFCQHFASNATFALQRAQMTRAILLRMISMAELRDPKETGAHVNRVAGYAVEIYESWSRRHGLPEREVEKTRDILRMAAMLHDVGKVAISDVILKKPGRFTPEEYAIMQEHSLLGAKLFANIQSELDEVASFVALTHHENWDGTGYPGYVDAATGEPLKVDSEGKVQGKRGEEIPILGRIVALADVYDALSCKRVYKEAWEEDKVLAEMRKLSGCKFDPELVDIFFDVLPNIKQITEMYPDKND
jgi:HD-GYP domain-containing protein (c-di-GMP phosphodiesterase class II)